MMCSIPSLSHITSNPGIWPCVAGGVAVGFACAIGAVHVLPPPAFCEPKPQKPAGKIVLHYFPIPAMGEPIRLLLEHRGGTSLEVDGRGKGGWTALGLAARANHLAVAEALLDRGADPHLAFYCGKSALDIARNNKRTKMIELLERPRERNS